MALGKALDEGRAPAREYTWDLVPYPKGDGSLTHAYAGRLYSHTFSLPFERWTFKIWRGLKNPKFPTHEFQIFDDFRMQQTGAAADQKTHHKFWWVDRKRPKISPIAWEIWRRPPPQTCRFACIHLKLQILISLVLDNGRINFGGVLKTQNFQLGPLRNFSFVNFEISTCNTNEVSRAQFRRRRRLSMFEAEWPSKG